MLTSNTPTHAYAVGYTDDHGVDTDRPEHELWWAVLRQAADDLLDPNERIRADATSFFMGPDLVRVLDLAGVDRDVAPMLRKQAVAVSQQSGRSRRRRGITYQGKTRSALEWIQANGLTASTIVRRLRRNWSVERALSLPLQTTGRPPVRSSVAHQSERTLGRAEQTGRITLRSTM